MKYLLSFIWTLGATIAFSQVQWKNVDTAFGRLPNGFHVYYFADSVNEKAFRGYYAEINLKNKSLLVETDTTFKRRLTPQQYFEKNNAPLLVVNTTFFSFATNQNLNLVVKNGKMVSYNIHTIAGKGKDTLTYRHPFNGAIGISKKRKADIGWVYSDSSGKYPMASQVPLKFFKDSFPFLWDRTVSTYKYRINKSLHSNNWTKWKHPFKEWEMHTAVAGGPVLVQDAKVSISNEEELKFQGKAINERHPRTLMGYTKDNKLIIMVVEGRNPGIAAGITLTEAAQLMIDIGCVEALNLDGGGSSCMLINGKETIWPSDKGKQRPVPAVLMIKQNGAD